MHLHTDADFITKSIKFQRFSVRLSADVFDSPGTDARSVGGPTEGVRIHRPEKSLGGHAPGRGLGGVLRKEVEKGDFGRFFLERKH